MKKYLQLRVVDFGYRIGGVDDEDADKEVLGLLLVDVVEHGVYNLKFIK